VGHWRPVYQTVDADGSPRATLIRLLSEPAATLALIDSRPACKEGSCMDPLRFPHATHRLAPDSQTACGGIQ